MASDPLVSIIVPVYRMDKYLDRCMASLLAQSHQNLDIILVDDGSPDRSGEICDGFAARDARVRVVHQDNAGPSAARNAGIDRAQGSYLTFVDPDDWVHPDLVAYLVRLADEAWADVAVCRFLRTDSEDVSGARVAGEVRALGSDEALRLYAGPTTSWMTSPCAKIFAARLFDGVRFPVGRLYEDEFTTYRLVAAADRVVLSDAVLYFYFARPGSATHGEQRVQQLLDRVDALRQQAVFFETRGMPHVSGNCLRRAFLIQRQLRARVVASGDQGLRRRLADETRGVGAALRRSPESLPIKVLASVYAVWPQAADAAIKALQVLSGGPRARRSRRPKSERCAKHLVGPTGVRRTRAG